MASQYLQQFSRTTVASGNYLIPISDDGSGRVLAITKDNLFNGLYTQSSGILDLNTYELTLQGNATLNQDLTTTSIPTFNGLITPSISSVSSLSLLPNSGSPIDIDLRGQSSFIHIDSFDGGGLNFSRSTVNDIGASITYDTNDSVKWTFGPLGDGTENFRLWNNVAGADAINVNSATNKVGITNLSVNTFDVTVTANTALNQNLRTFDTPTHSGIILNNRLTLGSIATSPTSPAGAADTVYLTGVDKTAGDRRLYVQGELGSAVTIGNDRLNFAATTGLMSINGIDTISSVVSGVTVLGRMGIGVTASTVASALLCVGGNPTQFTGANYINVTDATNGGALVLSKDANNYAIIQYSAASSAFAFATVDAGTAFTQTIGCKSGNVIIGGLTIPGSATRNFVLSGGATSPVLGTATADMVSLAAVDKAAGDRRLYLQSELGSSMSLGNNRFNYTAPSGYVSIASTDVFTYSASGVAINGSTARGVLIGQGVNPVSWTGAGTSGNVLVAAGAGADPYWSSNANIRSVPIIIGDGVNTITTSLAALVCVPYTCTIIGYDLVSLDNTATLVTGSIVLDLWKAPYASLMPVVGNTITASALPTLSSANKTTDSTLTGWTTSVAAGDYIKCVVNSVTTCKQVILTLKVRTNG